MQNPFTTTFSKSPEAYIVTEKPNEILENFSFDNPTESVYKITGVRGSGKTVILGKIEEALRSDEARANGWIVLDINPNRDMLMQLAAGLQKEGLGKTNKSGQSLTVSANFLGTGGGIGYSYDNDNSIFDIGVEIDTMLEAARNIGKKILIGIDEVSKTSEMISFTAEYGRWLRANYPVFLVCTGLYENIQEIYNVKNLTFFRRATTIQAEPLNTIRMCDMYRTKLNISKDTALEMARITKGYAYAFQELGQLYFKNGTTTSFEDIIENLKSELFAYSYEKIWEELSEADKALVTLLVDKEEYKREEILKKMDSSAGNYSVYRDRLIKKGLLNSRQGYVGLSLPYFADYVKEYCAP